MRREKTPGTFSLFTGEISAVRHGSFTVDLPLYLPVQRSHENDGDSDRPVTRKMRAKCL